MNKVFLVLGVAFIFMTKAPAREQKPATVVKIYSHPCALASQDYRGSGVVFRHNEHLYVLTSEHVLLHGRKVDGICHQVRFPAEQKIAERSAELLIADWQSGLAILKLNDSSMESPVPSLAELFSTEELSSGTNIEVNGFPYASDEHVVSTWGQILSKNSLRHLLPNKRTIYEVGDAAGEFGMSGGPIFDRTGAVAGLLSHQYLLQKTGPAMVGSFNNEGSVENHLLIIKGRDLQEWVAAAFTTDFRPGFVRNQRDQRKNEDVVYSGGLIFRAVRQDKPCSAAEPIGGIGGDPVGVGGDPVGVGGGGDHLPTSIVVEVSKDRRPTESVNETRWNIPKLESWFNKVNDALLRAERVYTPGLIYRRENQNGVSLVCTKSLEEFFRKAVADGTTPFTYREGGASGVDSGRLVKNLNEEATKLVAHAKELQARIGKKSELLSYAEFYGQLLSSPDNFPLVRPDDLSPLDCVTEVTCPFREEWSSLFSSYMNETVEVLKALKAVRHIRQKIEVN